MRHGSIVLLVALVVAAHSACAPAPAGNEGPSGLGQGRLVSTTGGISGGSGPHLEQNGLVVVEAEHYTSAQGNALGNRHWYLQAGAASGPGPDPDGFHSGASGNAYMEVLPDRRVTHDDPLAAGSFYDGAGGATLHYAILFETAGTYFVWVRAYSTGTEDNGLHVGLDGQLSESGLRIQRCGTGDWSWTSAKRDTGGTACGVNGTITLAVPSPGLHTITFHQREDGFELDRFVLTTEGGDVPGGAGPPESPRQTQ